MAKMTHFLCGFSIEIWPKLGVLLKDRLFWTACFLC